MEVINTVGRRKTAIARVYVQPGNGKITVNKRELENYFSVKTLQNIVLKPLELTNNSDKLDIAANLDGGGIKGQAEALRLAISRALIEMEPEHRPLLKSNGFLRRDPRMVERKKPGQKKARKRFQFSKR
ncbi:MAG TPA: 30S ribosomal protein S9 [Bacteroidales bacterium]|nr:30S ribosomal protein S9 [Bacteroidales bacterium]HPR58299.1 30S ribosomal protein S9 [Bacteroidales bacterium]HRW96902.1 30S ribosomal protein S9 [Bacteroidales bacterium]